MWLPVPKCELNVVRVDALELPIALGDASVSSKDADPARLRPWIDDSPMPWLQLGSLLELKGPYDRRLAFTKPETGGYARREYGLLVQVKDGHGLVVKRGPTLEWWNLREALICVGLDAMALSGLVHAATWLIRALTGFELNGVFVRRMAHGVILEGSDGKLSRGVVLANKASMSRETLAMSAAATYDIVAGPFVNVSTVQTAIATACEGAFTDGFERLQTATLKLNR